MRQSSSGRILELEVQSANSESRLNIGDYNKYASKHKKRRKICMVVLCAHMLLSLTYTILSLTVLKPKHPVTKLESLAFEDLDVSVDPARLKVFLNITMSGDLSIENPNRVSFQYDDIYPYFEYRDELVGDVHVPAGEIGARSTTKMNFTVIIMADRLTSNSNLYSDVVEKGILQLTAYLKLKGKAKFGLFFKVRVKVSSKCDLSLDIHMKTVDNQSCHSKTKL